jgi:hypothetical protein
VAASVPHPRRGLLKHGPRHAASWVHRSRGLKPGRRRSDEAHCLPEASQRRTLGGVTPSAAAHPHQTLMQGIRLVGCGGRSPFMSGSTPVVHATRIRPLPRPPRGGSRLRESTRAGRLGGATARCRRSRSAGWRGGHHPLEKQLEASAGRAPRTRVDAVAPRRSGCAGRRPGDWPPCVGSARRILSSALDDLSRARPVAEAPFGDPSPTWCGFSTGQPRPTAGSACLRPTAGSVRLPGFESIVRDSAFIRHSGVRACCPRVAGPISPAWRSRIVPGGSRAESVFRGWPRA